MNRSHARTLSTFISNEDIETMLKKAAKEITDWTKPSKANKSLSRGKNWNIFAAKFKVEDKHHHMVKYRLIEEYGEFLPEEFQPKKKPKSNIITHHSPPDLSNWE